MRPPPYPLPHGLTEQFGGGGGDVEAFLTNSRGFGAGAEGGGSSCSFYPLAMWRW
jgi:hypothetical protein